MDHTQIGNRLLWETVQRQLITETLQDYAYYVDRNDPEGLVSQVFCEDGAFELGARHAVVGRAELAKMFAKTLAPFRATSHHVSNVRVRFDGDERAESSAYVYAWHIAADDGHRIDLWGRYHDQLRLTADGWRIAVRRLTVAGSDGWQDAPFDLIERLPNPINPPSPRVTRR
jgi:ketosteroid isomerase-like protein